MTDQPIEPKKPKVRRETKLDRELERRRKRMFNEALKEWHEFEQGKINDKLNALKKTPDAEWDKAVKNDEDTEL